MNERASALSRPPDGLAGAGGCFGNRRTRLPALPKNKRGSGRERQRGASVRAARLKLRCFWLVKGSSTEAGASLTHLRHAHFPCSILSLQRPTDPAPDSCSRFSTILSFCHHWNTSLPPRPRHPELFVEPSGHTLSRHRPHLANTKPRQIQHRRHVSCSELAEVQE